MVRTAMLLFALAIMPVAVEARQPSAPDPALADDSLEIVALAHRLTKDAKSDTAKAAAIYEWVGRNVAYDVANYWNRLHAHSEAEAVYRHRLALCSGFVQLFSRLAAEAGLETASVFGYAKGFDHVRGQSANKPNHVWLAIRLSDGWGLIDPTWAAGMVVGGRFVPKFSWDYFLVNPDVMLLSHLPSEEKWQLVQQPMRRSQFERLPVVPRELLGVGFTAAAIRRAGETRVDSFPQVGVPAARVRVMDAPVSGKLRKASAVPVRIEWPSASDVALVTGGKWIPLARAGDVFHGQAVAAAGPFYVVGRTGPAQPYQTLLMYRVD